jgi:branched-chain amino acid transport system permease protein
MASALGVNIKVVNMATFAFGSALAGAGGALLAPVVGVVPSMGSAYIARAFMTVVVGGPGVLTGTAAASSFLGGIEYAVSYATTPYFGVGALLLAAIVILRVMPNGISGRLGRQL